MTTAERPKVYSCERFLTAAYCGPKGTMSLRALVDQIIETATEHANILNIGYEDLKSHGIAWVLSRLSVETGHMPAANTSYRVETWIDGFNKRYSTRCHRFVDAEGNVFASVHTLWVVINMESRTGGTLDVIDGKDLVCDDMPAMPPVVRHIDFGNGFNAGYDYVTRYSDIDVNKHLTTLRYVDLSIDALPSEFLARHDLKRFDIMFHHEILCDTPVRVNAWKDDHDTSGQTVAVMELRADSRQAAAVSTLWHI